LGNLKDKKMDFINNFKTQTQKIIDLLKEDLRSIRTGRANPSLVENLVVETYSGSAKLKLLELSTITTNGPTELLISPFDPNIISDIEKAILKSPLGINPITQGQKIILRIPPLSSEQRDKFVKLVSKKIEERKNQIRSIRDQLRKSIKNSFEKKEITEDEKFRLEKEIDNITSQLMIEINNIKEKKEIEIKQV